MTSPRASRQPRRRVPIRVSISSWLTLLAVLAGGFSLLGELLVPGHHLHLGPDGLVHHHHGFVGEHFHGAQEAAAQHEGEPDCAHTPAHGHHSDQAPATPADDGHGPTTSTAEQALPFPEPAPALLAAISLQGSDDPLPTVLGVLSRPANDANPRGPPA